MPDGSGGKERTMERNTTCTLGEIICARRDLYLQEGQDALCQSLDWFIYTGPEDKDYRLDTLCLIADPPDYDDERELEIFPAICDEHRMYSEMMPEMLDDVIMSALDQKRDTTEEELLHALNYYAEMDAFFQF